MFQNEFEHIFLIFSALNPLGIVHLQKQKADFRQAGRQIKCFITSWMRICLIHVHLWIGGGN